MRRAGGVSSQEELQLTLNVLADEPEELARVDWG